MRLMIDTSQMSFMVTKAPEPRRDYGKTDQKVDKARASRSGCWTCSLRSLMAVR
jgi:hypothetical protein